MKILSLSNCPLDHALGSGRTRLAWAEGLRGLGHEVTGVESIELMGGSEGEPRGRRARLIRGAWQWLRQRDLSGYDLIEFFGAEFWLATWQLSRRRDAPLLVAHTDGLELLALERLRHLPGNWGRGMVRHIIDGLNEGLNRLAFSRADGFVTASGADRDYLLKSGLRDPATMEVVLLGLEPAYHGLPRRRDRQERVVFLASWIARKGIDPLVSVMTTLLRERPGLRLDLDGVGVEAPVPLEAFPQELRARITVRPRVTMAESVATLSQARVFFLPTEYEGFGLATAEAMACGCAVVTTPTGFGAELVDEKEALICPFGDAPAMGSALRRLLDDEALCSRIAEAGWQRAQGLRWEHSVRQLEAIYLRWLEKKSPPASRRA